MSDSKEPRHIRRQRLKEERKDGFVYRCLSCQIDISPRPTIMLPSGELKMIQQKECPRCQGGLVKKVMKNEER